MIRRRDLLVGAGASLTVRAQSQRPPNILFLLSDDQRWDALGCMGNPIIQTPHIDSLAKSGVRFTNMFVTTAICMSSRASILSGLYTRSHGVELFAQQFSEEQFNRTYPAVLRRSGYRTGFIGKYGLDKAPLPASGFDFWRGFSGQGLSWPKGEQSGPHMLDVMTDQAHEFLDTCKPNGDPFCLSLSYKHPHAEDNDPRQFLPAKPEMSLYKDVRIPTPKTADTNSVSQLPLSVQRSEGRKRWAARFSTPELHQESVKNYYRLCSGVDRSVGAILAQLNKNGLADNTIVVYTSDNGFYLGEHGLADKWFMHEESIRVPLIVRDPRAGALRNAVCDRMSLNIDLAPTLLDLAGAKNPPHLQGRALTPLLRGQTPASWRREFFYEHRFRNGGWIPATEGIRTEEWKYTNYIDESPVFEDLFHLPKDRYEENNLAKVPAHTQRLTALRARHATWKKALESWKPNTPWQDPV